MFQFTTRFPLIPVDYLAKAAKFPIPFVKFCKVHYLRKNNNYPLNSYDDT